MLATQGLLSDVLADRLFALPLEDSERFKSSRATSDLRLGRGFGPLDQSLFESLDGLVKDASKRLLEGVGEREAILREQRAQLSA